uniref:DUF802 domain-containing protein n=1 Tax=Serratia liquefaciens TaxID=614 RepID=UPI00356B7125
MARLRCRKARRSWQDTAHIARYWREHLAPHARHSHEIYSSCPRSLQGFAHALDHRQQSAGHRVTMNWRTYRCRHSCRGPAFAGSPIALAADQLRTAGAGQLHIAAHDLRSADRRPRIGYGTALLRARLVLNRKRNRPSG